jgi:hypothetical protein
LGVAVPQRRESFKLKGLSLKYRPRRATLSPFRA